MKASPTRSSVLTIVVSAAVAFGVIFMGATASSRRPGVDLDCSGGLRVAATYEVSDDAGAPTTAAAAKDAASMSIDDFDRVEAKDGTQLVQDGSRTVAAVSVIATDDGYIAEGIEACASDYVSP